MTDFEELSIEEMEEQVRILQEKIREKRKVEIEVEEKEEKKLELSEKQIENRREKARELLKAAETKLDEFNTRFEERDYKKYPIGNSWFDKAPYHPENFYRFDQQHFNETGEKRWLAGRKWKGVLDGKVKIGDIIDEKEVSNVRKRQMFIVQLRTFARNHDIWDYNYARSIWSKVRQAYEISDEIYDEKIRDEVNDVLGSP